MRNNALPYPVYGVAFTVVAPLLDADGDPISPSSPDSEVSKNGDTFADCTNEATEIATSSGVVYLTLTSTEMTADIVAVRIQSTGAKTTVLTLYPRKLPILSTGTCQGSNDTSDIQLASGDSAVDDTYNGCLCVAVIDGTTEARIINDYVGSTKVAEIAPAWNTAQPDSGDTYTIYLPEGRQVNTVNMTHHGGTAYTSGAIPAAVAGASGGLFIAGSNAATTANITGNLTGNVTGSVGSVTGAVGSVTGNVGGNVAGSVGSVTGAVGSVTGAVGSVTGNVGGNVAGSVGSVTAGVTVTTNNDKTGYTASTVSDKTGYALSAAGVDAIWDEAQSGHSTAGTFGKYLDDEISGVSGGGGGVAGEGSEEWVITIKDGSNNPLDGVAVWVTTDSAGTNVVAGTLHTDALGVVTFMLDVGTYYRWAQRSGINFTNPSSFTVS
jgi:hypothetical protein